jgi:hypothetical protein
MGGRESVVYVPFPPLNANKQKWGKRQHKKAADREKRKGEREGEYEQKNNGGPNTQKKELYTQQSFRILAFLYT